MCKLHRYVFHGGSDVGCGLGGGGGVGGVEIKRNINSSSLYKSLIHQGGHLPKFLA